MATALLSGCATGNFSMRTLPDETPAADNAAAIKSAAAVAAAMMPAARDATSEKAGAPSLAAAGAVTAPSSPVTAAAAPTAPAAVDTRGPPLTVADAPSMYSYDPWEHLNRFTYRFNAQFDENVFLPVANSYQRALPSPLRLGIHNFFSNLAEVKSIANYVLQVRLPNALRNFARFAINSTMGVGGLFDVAKEFHLPAAQTAFTTTLATYGVQPGPYLVVPLLGPSTLRDGGGYLADYGISYWVNLVHLYRGDWEYALGTVNAIDVRSNTNFRYYSTGSPLEYENIRFLFVYKELIEDEAVRRTRRPRAAGNDTPAGR
jgi:phospholipid-binding lipoprotein MlaA